MSADSLIDMTQTNSAIKFPLPFEKVAKQVSVDNSRFLIEQAHFYSVKHLNLHLYVPRQKAAKNHLLLSSSVILSINLSSCHNIFYLFSSPAVLCIRNKKKTKKKKLAKQLKKLLRSFVNTGVMEIVFQISN